MSMLPQVTIALLFFIAETFPDIPAQKIADIQTLVSRAKRGDRGAVATLYQLYSQKVFRYVVCRVPTNAEAEDITSDVFISMVKGLASYQTTGAPFDAWLYRIAAARVADFYRQDKRRLKVELSENIRDSSPLPEDLIQQNQTLDHLRNMLRQMPEDYQTILILRFVERKSHEEVALLTGKTVQAVRNVQHRALLRLTELLGADHKVRHYLRTSNE